jgi:hypothetical protein
MKDREEQLARENLKEIQQIEESLNQIEEVRKTKEDEDAIIRTIYKWKAPDRVFVPKSRNFFVLISIVFIVGIVVSAIMESLMFILVLVSLLALLFIQHTIAPREVEHEITNKGIKAFRRLYLWKDVDRFWVMRRSGHNLLHVEFKKFGERLILLIRDEDELDIVRELIKHIKYTENDESNFITKFTEGEFVPLVSYFRVESNPAKTAGEVKHATK